MLEEGEKEFELHFRKIDAEQSSTERAKLLAGLNRICVALDRCEHLAYVERYRDYRLKQIRIRLRRIEMHKPSLYDAKFYDKGSHPKVKFVETVAEIVREEYTLCVELFKNTDKQREKFLSIVTPCVDILSEELDAAVTENSPQRTIQGLDAQKGTTPSGSRIPLYNALVLFDIVETVSKSFGARLLEIM